MRTPITPAPPEPRRTLRQRGFLLLFAALGPLGLLGGCRFKGEPFPELVDEINATLQPNQLELVPGDQIEVRVARDAELTQQSTVKHDGMATFLDLGEIPVQGMSILELQELLIERYDEGRTSLGQLTVRVAPTGDRAAYFTGEIGRPGPVQVSPQRTSFRRAMAMAGGPRRATASMRKTLLLRFDTEQELYRAWYIDMRPRHWDTPKPLWLQPEDIVYIPHRIVLDIQAFWRQYVFGMIPFGTGQVTSAVL